MGQTTLDQAGSKDLHPGGHTESPPLHQEARGEKEPRSTPGEEVKSTLPASDVAETFVSPDPGTDIHLLRDETSGSAAESRSHTTGAYAPSEQHAMKLAAPSTVKSPTCTPHQQCDADERSKAVAAESPPYLPLPFTSTPLDGPPHTSHPSLFPPTLTTFPASALLTSGYRSPSAFVHSESHSMNPIPTQAPFSRDWYLASGTTAATPMDGALAEMASPVVPGKMDMSAANVSNVNDNAFLAVFGK
ncbi:hypothetical protein V5799_013720 [Amblyomma americanum]|uniref:Uncharacterized protein n=1 Tax=Amblyomma americanum TaxID=6943 RepID=A0AAQ4E525_AMBAM